MTCGEAIVPRNPFDMPVTPRPRKEKVKGNAMSEKKGFRVCARDVEGINNGIV